jgi:vacuolar-type H+-ATPase subunit I/STV1
MDTDAKIFRNISPDISLIDEIFRYDVRQLESTESKRISMYVVALSQYLIYLRSQVNTTKAEVIRNKRNLDNGVNQLITKEVIKEYKTKSDAYNHIVQNNEILGELNEQIENLKDELILVEGVDKTVSELIAALKRELTRRENELYSTRMERRS